MRIFRNLGAVLCALGSFACGGSETTYTDQGTVCLAGTPGGSHSVEVDFGVCMSSSCDSVVESSCNTTLSGTDLTITATATVEHKGGACTADCGALTVECETQPLPAGNYNLVYGTVEGTLTIPPINPDEPSCFGEGETGG
jgi:hypothetical protein